MLDIKTIRDSSESISESIKQRGGDSYLLIPQILDLDIKRRSLENQLQELQSQRNKASKEIGKVIATGGDVEEAKLAVKQISEDAKKLEDSLSIVSSESRRLLLSVPNIPHSECPVGADEDSNIELRTWGEMPEIANPLNHVELSEMHKLISFEDGARISGSGYVVYRGIGAKIERALIQFLLDLQTEENGYEEVNVPILIKRECMEGTGQLPKFEDDMFGIEENQMFLAPTAEVPVTNLYRDTLLKESDLPIKLTTHTPCFRREAGSAGKENKGIIRMHQFDKVELVQIVDGKDSMRVLDELTGHAELALQKLGLHYRVIELCTGDVGFSACKTFDIEVWSPGQNKFLEVSSCSSFGDYQARRMKLRYKNQDGKNVFCHTLNGSGTALPRLYVALIEQYQQADGSIKIPPALAKYLGKDEIKTEA